MTPIIFLDFDGVLHPEIFGAKEFSCAPILEEALKPFPDVKIILTTSWKYDHTVKEMRELLTEDLRQRVIRQTINLEKGLHVGGRQKEIVETMKNFPDNTWLAIDDWAHGFRDDTDQLLLINGQTGFTQNDAIRLQKKLYSYLAKPHKNNTEFRP